MPVSCPELVSVEDEEINDSAEFDGNQIRTVEVEAALDRACGTDARSILLVSRIEKVHTNCRFMHDGDDLLCRRNVVPRPRELDGAEKLEDLSQDRLVRRQVATATHDSGFSSPKLIAYWRWLDVVHAGRRCTRPQHVQLC